LNWPVWGDWDVMATRTNLSASAGLPLELNWPVWGDWDSENLMRPANFSMLELNWPVWGDWDY